jgi:hypothetical protein
VPNVSVHFYKGNNILYNTVSDSSGRVIVIRNFTGWSYIKISSVGYRELHIKPKASDTLLNKDFNLGIIELHANSIQLQEVIIKSSRRYRDTTKIDFTEKKFERSVSVNDLLSQTKSFYKDAKGQLYYKGKLVSNMTVNGSDFFGRNNLEIYNLLPALTVNSIKIIETNIDSVTNATTLNSTIKVDLILKEKYNNGKFGNYSLGGGTRKRNLLQGTLYTYKKNEQLSIALNSNNVNLNDNSISAPSISFSPSSNNLTINSAKFNYSNKYKDKISVDLSLKANYNKNDYNSIIERQDESNQSFSKIFNSSITKSYNITDSKFLFNYKIDSLNSISASQNFGYSKDNSSDSANYIVTLKNLNSSSLLKKERSISTRAFESTFSYLKKFRSNQGRLLNIDLVFRSKNYSVNESDSISLISNKSESYFVKGQRDARDNSYNLITSFTEPIGNSGYINLYVGYQFNNIAYNTVIKSDTTINTTDTPISFVNQFIKPGLKIQKTVNKMSITSDIVGIFYFRKIEHLANNKKPFLFNLNFNADADYKISAKKNLTFSYSAVTSYPTIQQLTNLTNTFDLVFQMAGNALLDPETKYTSKLLYTAAKSDSLNVFVSGQYDYFNNKFGYIINNNGSLGVVQNTVVGNVGKSSAANVSFTLSKILSRNRNIGGTTTLSYQEIPTVVDGQFQLNNGFTLNQSLSGNIPIIKSSLSLTPILSYSYSKFFYPNNNINIHTATYSDKISLELKGYQLNLYPLYTYNHSLQTNSSFSMNGEIRKSLFKSMGVIWFQAYDIFKSFHFYNNFVGASFYQSIKYSTVDRYLILGISFKLNNFK